MSNEYSEFLYIFQIKLKLTKSVSKIRQVFFYLNVTANLSPGGTDFLILVSLNTGLGQAEPAVFQMLH